MLVKYIERNQKALVACSFLGAVINIGGMIIISTTNLSSLGTPTIINWYYALFYFLMSVGFGIVCKEETFKDNRLLVVAFSILALSYGPEDLMFGVRLINLNGIVELEENATQVVVGGVLKTVGMCLFQLPVFALVYTTGRRENDYRDF